VLPPKVRMVVVLHTALLTYHLPWCDLHVLLLHSAVACCESCGVYESAGITELDELVGHVFLPFVILQFLDFRIELVFSSSLEKLEGLKCLTLLLQVHGSSVGCHIIKEGDPVAVSFTGGNRERTMQVGVNQFEWLCGTRWR